MADAGAIQAAWLAALEKRHLASLTRQEFTRAVRALSARYVERRGQLPERSPLDSAGKRAAFALFYAPLHFLTADLALSRAGVRTGLKHIVDLGCGTGVCGAAWALRHAPRPSLAGVDASAWAVNEARWNWRTMGLRGQASRGDLLAAARGLLKQPAASLSATGLIAGWTVNELPKAARDQLLDVIDDVLARGATVVILEPLARGVTPWWDEWTSRLAPHGIQSSDIKAAVELPQPLAGFSAAAGFRKDELGARLLLGSPGLQPAPID